MDEKENRDNFSAKVKEIVKQRAAFICSNPSCRKMTIASSMEDETKVQYIGVCSHITAAIKGGPRYDEMLDSSERIGINNAIFLCANCSVMIDKNDGLDYSTEDLKQWKAAHEKWILDNLNKSITSDSVIIKSNNQMGGITANVVNLNGDFVDKSFEKQKGKEEHDRKIFEKADKILNGVILKNILGTLLGDESIRANDLEKMETLKFFYLNGTNQYIHENLEKLKEEFVVAINNLNEFIGTDFDMWPYEQRSDNYRICMNPRVNGDRGGTLSKENLIEHSRLQKILEERISETQNTFDKLRREIKITLYI